MGIAAPRDRRHRRRFHRRLDIGQIDPGGGVMVMGKSEVARNLVWPVAGLLGLQLDQPQLVLPEQRVIGATTRFVVSPWWQLELVHELRHIAWPRLAEAH